jgi:hypothetical protein
MNARFSPPPHSIFSLGIAGQVLTFHTRARLSFAPPPCRMPLGQSQCIPQADPGGMATPRFWHRLIRFRHVISGSLALASLNHTCRNLVPTFPQRSPPSLLTTAACGGLRSTPDCRPRRALLHLSYSYAPPCGPALLVTQCHNRTRRGKDSQISGANCMPQIGIRTVQPMFVYEVMSRRPISTNMLARTGSRKRSEMRAAT